MKQKLAVGAACAGVFVAVLFVLRALDRPTEVAPRTIATEPREPPSTSLDAITSAADRPSTETATAAAARALQAQAEHREPRTKGTISVALNIGFAPRPNWVLELSATTDEAHVATHRDSLAREIVYLDDVWPGENLLRVACAECVTVEARVSVKAGFTTPVTLDLDCRAPPGWADVTIRSQSHRFQDQVDVTWLSANTAGYAPVEWIDTDGEIIGRCRVDLAAAAEIELTFSTHSEFGFWPSNRVRVQPDRHVDLVVQDLAPRVDVGFRVVDGQTLAALDDFDVSWSLGQSFAGGSQHRHAKSGDVLLHDVPDGSSLFWQISKAGYACAEGYICDAEVSADGKTRWLRVVLHAGVKLRVTTQLCTIGTVGGVPIFADDVELGRTDRNGQFEVVLPQAPNVVEARPTGWKACGTDGPLLQRFDARYSCSGVSFYLIPEH